jgi:DNA primase large subunit
VTSCQTILTTFTPGVTESHGCPYRHFSEDNLRLALQSTMGISSHDLQDIMTSVKSEHYHVACTRVYELTHGSKRGEGIGGGESVTHPNGYAQRSRELEKARADAATKEDAMKID